MRQLRSPSSQTDRPTSDPGQCTDHTCHRDRGNERHGETDGRTVPPRRGREHGRTPVSLRIIEPLLDERTNNHLTLDSLHLHLSLVPGSDDSGNVPTVTRINIDTPSRQVRAQVLEEGTGRGREGRPDQPGGVHRSRRVSISVTNGLSESPVAFVHRSVA